MCFSPIPQETLKNTKHFDYKSRNDSILYNKCLSPLSNKVANYLPKWFSPNLITLISLLFNIMASVISYLDGGFDFSHKLKPRTCLIIGIFQFIYQILNNIDEAQARRIGNSDPFGILMHHSCDIFNNIFTAFNLTKLLLLGNDYYYSYFIFLALFLGFYIMKYEEYKLGEMHFLEINGADEGNFLIFLLGIFLYFFGQGYMTRLVHEDYLITIGQLIGSIVVISSVFLVIKLYFISYDIIGPNETAKIFLENIPFYSVILVPLAFIAFNLDFYKENKWIILFNAALLFARNTIDIQIKILTLDKLSFNTMLLFSNLAFIISLFIYVDINKIYFLILLFVAQATELYFFIIRRAKEISDFLEIRIFCVNNQTIKL